MVDAHQPISIEYLTYNKNKYLIYYSPIFFLHATICALIRYQ